MVDEWWQAKIKVFKALSQKPLPVPLCSPQILHYNLDLNVNLCGKLENKAWPYMKNYLPQRHKEENKKCTLLLTSTLFYERQYMVSITQKLREIHIKI